MHSLRRFGRFTLAEVARMLDENEATLRRLLRGRRKMRRKTCERILDKVMTIIEPPKPRQPELFT